MAADGRHFIAWPDFETGATQHAFVQHHCRANGWDMYAIPLHHYVIRRDDVLWLQWYEGICGDCNQQYETNKRRGELADER